MEMEMEWPSYLDEYQKLIIRMNTPRVVVDNAVCCSATLVKVDSARNHHAFLLGTVQVLTGLDLSITKAYITSDGAYSMDVFHVTDRHGRKLTDPNAISYIQRSLQTPINPSSKEGYYDQLGLTTALELTGPDRPGLLSEIFAVLSDLNCTVTEADVWTHNGRVASVIFVIADTDNRSKIESTLAHLLRGSAVLSSALCHVDRRLHQMMFLDRDYQQQQHNSSSSSSSSSSPVVAVSIQNLAERGYSVVNISCRNRPKLLFDVVCALTDMEYVVFHGTVDTAADGDTARQEFYVRHSDGTPIRCEAERQRVILCLQAAIERRSYKGLTLELSSTDDGSDHPVLLTEVTRAIRENGLSVVRAEVSTASTCSSVFHVTDADGRVPDVTTVDSVRRRIGLSCLRVKDQMVRTSFSKSLSVGGAEDDDKNKDRAASLGLLLCIGGLVLRNLYNFGFLIRSSS